jgi:hypothetical protein
MKGGNENMNKGKGGKKNDSSCNQGPVKSLKKGGKK